MKIVFLSPAGAMHRYSGNFHRNLHYAPITMTLLASLIPEEYNAEVLIYDETVETIPLDITADILCITCITGTAPRHFLKRFTILRTVPCKLDTINQNNPRFTFAHTLDVTY